MPFFPNGCRALLDAWRAAHTLAVSWHTSAPNANGSNSYALNGAARLAVGTLTTSTSGSAGTATNASSIESVSATAAWARLTHLAIVSAMSGGAFYAYSALGSAVTLGAGEKIRIPAGDLDISIPTS